MPRVEVGSLSLAYEEHGPVDGPPLLFIMGLTGSRHHWLGFDRGFSDGHRVISFDNRGVGESDVPRGPYSMPSMAKDTLRLLDALGIARASIVGVSMGGMIAQELALMAPDRVDRLVLGCTHPGGAEHLPPADDVVAVFTGGRKGNAEETVRALLCANFSEGFMESRPDVIDALIAHGLQNRMSPVGFMGQLQAVAGHDTSSRLGSLRHPTLIITGDQDRLVPDANSRLLAGRVVGSKLEVLERTGHMFWVERPGEAALAVRAHLAATGPATQK